MHHEADSKMGQRVYTLSLIPIYPGPCDVLALHHSHSALTPLSLRSRRKPPQYPTVIMLQEAALILRCQKKI